MVCSEVTVTWSTTVGLRRATRPMLFAPGKKTRKRLRGGRILFALASSSGLCKHMRTHNTADAECFERFGYHYERLQFFMPMFPCALPRMKKVTNFSQGVVMAYACSWLLNFRCTAYGVSIFLERLGGCFSTYMHLHEFRYPTCATC